MLDSSLVQNINWKKWKLRSPNEPHPHADAPHPDTIRYARGHYVIRPFQKYVTTKWEIGFMDTYEVLFHPIKHKPDTVFLELGVYTGESMGYFREFFTHPDAKIVGFDHRPCDFYADHLPYSGDPHNVVFWKGDQHNSSDLRAVGEAHGLFDVIMDDADHAPQLTEDTFNILWPYLKKDGLYIIEDVGEGEIMQLLAKVVTSGKGKGFMARPRGFGPYLTGPGGSTGPLLVMVKTEDRMSGLDAVLEE